MLTKYLSLVKFAHTLFALPFALVGYFLASSQSDTYELKVLILVVLCMVFARNAAMGFNRFIDRKIDAENERTRIREIPAGQISPNSAVIFVSVNCILFSLTTYFINPLVFSLSPIALMVILGYSYSKRITALCHFILGLGLSLAPVGAWLAVTGTFDWRPIVLGFTVLTWVGGFDIIYALQDENFDREQGLHSIPSLFGKNRALQISNALHFCTAILLGFFGFLIEGGFLFWTGACVFWCLLAYQHFLVKPNDLTKVNLAFFTTNGIASLFFATFCIIDILIR